MDSVTLHSANLENIVVGDLNAKWSAKGDRILRYYIDIRHKTMNLHKELSAPDMFILQSKIDALMASWDEKFIQYEKRKTIVAGQDTAEDLTVEENLKIESLKNILEHTLHIDDKIIWSSLKDYSKYNYPKNFPEAKPRSSPTKQPVYEKPKISFLQMIMGKKKLIIEEAEASFRDSISIWEKSEEKRRNILEKNVAEWELRRKNFWEKHKLAEDDFKAKQAASHADVDNLSKEVENGVEEAIIEHASLVLDRSDYNELFEKSYLLQYDPTNKLIKIAYNLPSIDVLPCIKSIKFIKMTGEFKESLISVKERKSNFESVAYQICLRTIHELFEADENSNIDSILFNGFVEFIDPATGQEARSCLLSILVDKETFSAIDLARIDPKACFKSLKGISAASLSSLAPVAPIMDLETEDRRFIDSKDVGSALNQDTNLAEMSWEDFEHLVREVFDKEFASRGGEVKVTQSSSDGGVDAIAFDPDPITGGKIVIQAKRYTRTVGISAVRDLYGTVMNEGASRGILVTTSDYGPDAYKFASDKPITLMGGANLLFMLERHGFKAKIDIAAARIKLS